MTINSQVEHIPATNPLGQTIDETGMTQPGTAEKIDGRTHSSKQGAKEFNPNQLLNVQVHASNQHDPMKQQTRSGFSEPGMASDAISYNEQMFAQ